MTSRDPAHQSPRGWFISPFIFFLWLLSAVPFIQVRTGRWTGPTEAFYLSRCVWSMIGPFFHWKTKRKKKGCISPFWKKSQRSALKHFIEFGSEEKSRFLSFDETSRPRGMWRKSFSTLENSRLPHWQFSWNFFFWRLFDFENFQICFRLGGFLFKCPLV